MQMVINKWRVGKTYSARARRVDLERKRIDSSTGEKGILASNERMPTTET